MKSRKIWFVLLAVVLIGAAVVAFKFVQQRRQPPSVIVITIDTLRSDHCSSYGYSRPTTPVLDEVARQGTRFDIAYAVSSTTAPSHATLFSGTYPLTHGVTKNGHVLRQDVPLLAAVFQSRGYETAAFVSSFVLNEKFGFSRGFKTYDDKFKRADASIDWRRWQGEKVDGGFDRRANATTDKVIEWLNRRDKSAPFFLWIHYFDPHHPYDPPRQYRSRFGADREILPEDMEGQKSLYDGEIRFTDEQLGRVLAALDQQKLRDRSILVLASDHGEGFMEHGVTGHGKNLYEEAVRIPLIIRWPGHIKPGQLIEAPAGLIDVAPTLAALTRVSMPDLQGISLVPYLTGEKQPERDRKMFLQRRRYNEFKGDFFGLRWGNYKLLHAPEEEVVELYDLQKDPGEKTNLAVNSEKVVQQFTSELQQWEAKTTRAQTPQKEISADDEERLKALGYVQ